MIIKDEILELLHSTETYRVERTTSTGDMDKFQEAICAFANDNGGNIGGKTGGKVGGDVVENIVENIIDSIVEKLSTTRAKIVRIICKNPNATAQSISKEINIASRNVQEHLRKLQEQGVIRRIGPDKGGHWEIIAPQS